MSKIVFVTSGKGGVGKSTVSTLLGRALGFLGKKVLLLELDFGLRGLDILNGVSDEVLFDIEDIFEGRCEPIKAIVRSSLNKNLYLIPTTNNIDFVPNVSDLRMLLKGLASYYDYLILDSPAGFSEGFKVGAKLADIAVVVTAPNAICVRDSAKVSEVLRKLGAENIKLIINKSPKRFIPSEFLPDYDAIIDKVGARLLGVIPEDACLRRFFGLGKMDDGQARIIQVFGNIARRLEGEYVDLLIK
ncbi:MAG: P-loop NTPase [Oscillospiraceae bacterium]